MLEGKKAKAKSENFVPEGAKSFICNESGRKKKKKTVACKFLMIVVHFDDCVLRLAQPRKKKGKMEKRSRVVSDMKQQCLI